MEGDLYMQLNTQLREHNRTNLKKHYFPYIRILMEGLRALCTGHKVTLNRGVKRALVAANPEKYVKGNSLIWWSFTSTTANVEVC